MTIRAGAGAHLGNEALGNEALSDTRARRQHGRDRPAGGRTFSAPESAVDRLVHAGVRGVALTFVDTAGITRVKTVPLARLDADRGQRGRHVAGVRHVRLRRQHHQHRPARRPGRGPAAGARPRPAGAPGRAARLGLGAGRPVRAGRHAATPPASGCSPRAWSTAAAERGLSLQMAFEIEWALGERGRADFVPACAGPAYGMTRLVELSDYAAELLGALEQAGLRGRAAAPGVRGRAVRGVGRPARPGGRGGPLGAGPADHPGALLPARLPALVRARR